MCVFVCFQGDFGGPLAVDRGDQWELAGTGFNMGVLQVCKYFVNISISSFESRIRSPRLAFLSQVKFCVAAES